MLKTSTTSKRPTRPYVHTAIALAIAAGMVIAGCDSGSEPEVEIEDLVVGEGATPGERDIVIIEYVGMLTDGTVFDSSGSRGALRFQLKTGIIYGLPEGQSGRVIQGLLDGVTGMKVGGVRRITIPPELAYGRSGYRIDPDTYIIPPNATIVFEVELIGVVTPPE